MLLKKSEYGRIVTLKECLDLFSQEEKLDKENSPVSKENEPENVFPFLYFNLLVCNIDIYVKICEIMCLRCANGVIVVPRAQND